MQRSELQSLLLANNLREPPDWNQIMIAYPPSSVEINGQTVYRFYLSLDVTYTPIEDSIVISQGIPNSDVPMHIHDYIEMVYVHQGNCTIEMHHGEVNIHEGGIILIDKQTPHTLKKTSVSDIIIEIKLKKDYLSPAFLSRFKKKSTISQFLIDSLIDARRMNSYLHFPFEHQSNVREIMMNIVFEHFDRDFGSSDMIDSYLFILFTDLIRNSHSNTSIQAGNMSRKDAVVIDFLRYIEENYQTCSLAEMGTRFTFHPNYISSLLKKATGKSFMDLLQSERLNNAAIYLSNSDLSIPDIAENVGYSSPFIFP
jgi:AraC-like DNA-binding protein/mannose-6-phosphate isomerase-like protein (cupin superfamily)